MPDNYTLTVGKHSVTLGKSPSLTQWLHMMGFSEPLPRPAAMDAIEYERNELIRKCGYLAGALTLNMDAAVKPTDIMADIGGPDELDRIYAEVKAHWEAVGFRRGSTAEPSKAEAVTEGQ